MDAVPASGAGFRRVLIANRGEIAVRIARTIREMGLVPIGIYSEVDRHAPHLRLCDAAYCVGPAQAAHSYLRHDVILAAARVCGAEAVHPGYGFLSENAEFAEAVVAAGLCWIGPPAAAMRTMGSKTAARRAMLAAGVACVPGSEGSLQDLQAAAAAAVALGYPVMLKAAAGGGGKGMRLVHEAAALGPALRAARSEAQSAFGDASVYMEKALVRPRHVEVQIFATADGTVYGLGERDCSMQRRHQKVIEETPCPALDDGGRARIVAVACQAARAVGYRGAGTVEFLLDASGDFYFLEMNTRLQVEHPVTELCFGIDLVAAQIYTAQGRRPAWHAQVPSPRGHAIEVRLYAEDPARQFMPSPGTVTSLRWPQGPGVRVDSGVDAGQAVSTHYDPLLGKLAVWAPTRTAAIARLRCALAETAVHGLQTNKHMLARLIDDAAFVSGDYHTGTLAACLAAPEAPLPPRARRAALIAATVQTFLQDSQAPQPVAAPAGRPLDAWQTATATFGVR